MLEIRTVLVPVDFSGGSRAAFVVARALARDHGARLVVLHVAVAPPFVTPGELEGALQARDGYRAQVVAELRRLYPSDAPSGIEYRVLTGEPAVEILASAREADGGLIVMGTHGRTGLVRLLVGSVAEKVLRTTPCPVLTVKTPGGETSPSGKDNAGRAPGNAPETLQGGAYDDPCSKPA
jgi:nucleotide-binding universal stress UspA family protein